MTSNGLSASQANDLIDAITMLADESLMPQEALQNLKIEADSPPIRGFMRGLRMLAFDHLPGKGPVKCIRDRERIIDSDSKIVAFSPLKGEESISLKTLYHRVAAEKLIPLGRADGKWIAQNARREENLVHFFAMVGLDASLWLPGTLELHSDGLLGMPVIRRSFNLWNIGYPQLIDIPPWRGELVLCIKEK